MLGRKERPEFMQEQRHTFMKLSKGNWITLGIFFISSVGGGMIWSQTYGQTLQQVEINTKNIEKLPEKFREEIKASERRLTKRMDKQDKYRREDMKEIRSLIREIK